MSRDNVADSQLQPSFPRPRWPRPRWASAWRGEVRDQAQRLDDDLALVPASDPRPAAYDGARASIDRARAFADASTTLTAWWSGSNIEGAWANLGGARESLVRLQDEATVRAQLPYLRSLAAKSSDTKDLIGTEDTAATPDRAAIAQVMRAHNVHVTAEHNDVRHLRNIVVGITALLALLMCIAAGVTDREHRIVIGVGAIAGTLTTVLAVSSARRTTGPYGLLGPQALLKVFAGSATALLADILLYKGVGSLGPAQGDAAYFVAVIFGFSQQLFTQLVDNKATDVLGKASPRSGPISEAAAQPPERA